MTASCGAELTSLRFLHDADNVLIMGPLGVEKTFLANVLGHIAVRRGPCVHTKTRRQGVQTAHGRRTG